MRIKRAAEFARKGLQYSLQAIFSGTAEKRVQARRRIALASVYRFRKEITFRRDGFTWTGPSQSYVIRMLYVYGCNPQNVDLQSQESLGKWIIGDRPFLVNVGANIGDTALPLSRIGKKILAIEPSPESFAYLQKNVIQNDLEGAIICCQMAISDAAGLAELVLSEQSVNDELAGESGTIGFAEKRRGMVLVPTERLGDLLNLYQIPHDQVAFVWSDTQGSESLVIESGVELWASGTPLWVEVWPKGLDCHGGSERFVELCKQYFKCYLTTGPLREELHPIEELSCLVKDLKVKGGFTDILLIS